MTRREMNEICAWTATVGLCAACGQVALLVIMLALSLVLMLHAIAWEKRP